MGEEVINFLIHILGNGLEQKYIKDDEQEDNNRAGYEKFCQKYENKIQNFVELVENNTLKKYFFLCGYHMYLIRKALGFRQPGLLKNSEGDTMRPGTKDCMKLYCGELVGTFNLGNSDGRCGPA